MSGGIVVVVALLALAIISINLSIHQVKEGFVGVYWRGGALLPTLSEPGFHLKLPFVTQVENVQVTVQTDRCGTSGGVMIYFESIEVINFLEKSRVYETIKNYTVNYDKTWIYDRIHHSVNQFCSAHTLQEVYIELFDTIDEQLVAELQNDCNQWAPGIHIIGCRVTKPKIPSTILHNYELMEAEKTKFLILSQKQRVIEKEAETERVRATIEAEMAKNVAKIRLEKELMEKETKQKSEEIGNAIHVAHQKALADAYFYQHSREAEANSLMLTPQFILLESIRALANNTKVYFGEKIPAMFMDQQLTHSDIQRFLGDSKSSQ